MKLLQIFVSTLILTTVSSLAGAQDRMLMDFDNAEARQGWQIVNDGVMGGLSQGRLKFNDDQQLEFWGTLSLENNGGFASIRTRVAELELKPKEAIVLRLRGDGREYNFNLYVQADLGGYSYRQSFKTNADTWIEVRLPIDQFVATYRGREFPDRQLDPSQVTGVGVLLGDKQAGPFKLEVEWIKAGPVQTQKTGTVPGNP